MGKFYISIDKNLKAKGIRPDNAYRFVEKLFTSNSPQDMTVNYNLDDTAVHALQIEVDQCNEEIRKLTTDFAALQLQMEDTQKDLQCTQQALGDVVSELKSNYSQLISRKTAELEEYRKHASCEILSWEDEVQAV